MNSKRKRLSKKAQGVSTIKVLVLAIIVGAIIIAMTTTIVTKFSEQVGKETCKLSIAKAHKIKEISKGTTTIQLLDIKSPLKCEQERIEIQLDDVVRSGKIRDDLVKKAIAELMYSCWNMVGEGELYPFRDANWDDSDTWCLRCSEIKFSKELQERAKKEGYFLENLDYYFATRAVAGTATLYEYIHEEKLEPEFVNQLKVDQSDLDSRIKKRMNLEMTYNIIWRFEREDTFTWFGLTETEFDWSKEFKVLDNPIHPYLPKKDGKIWIRTDDESNYIRSAAVGLGVTYSDDATSWLGNEKDKVLTQQVFFTPERLLGADIAISQKTDEEEHKTFCRHVLN